MESIMNEKSEENKKRYFEALAYGLLQRKREHQVEDSSRRDSPGKKSKL
jgi:hypothetical protein